VESVVFLVSSAQLDLLAFQEYRASAEYREFRVLVEQLVPRVQLVLLEYRASAEFRALVEHLQQFQVLKA
jgi:hypothetical protein